MNGYFQLVITPKGTGIKVFPPTDGGEPLNVNDVRDYLDDRKIEYDVVLINDAVTKAEAERLEAERLEEEARAAMEAEGGEDIGTVADQELPPEF
jgi:hypothetical protein